ncbi:MAG: hypothetical protein ACRDWA_08070 [Acidimicrobiia bacterium]
MSTVSRALAAGTGMGAVTGAAIGVVIASIQLLDLEGIELVQALVIYGAIGAILGMVAGTASGGALGLLVGLALNLLLGPASQVPRRTEQLPMARAVGSTIGLLPLIALPLIDEWWPAAIIVSLIAIVVIAKRVPKIAGITSLSTRSPNLQRSSP